MQNPGLTGIQPLCLRAFAVIPFNPPFVPLCLGGYSVPRSQIRSLCLVPWRFLCPFFVSLCLRGFPVPRSQNPALVSSCLRGYCVPRPQNPVFVSSCRHCHPERGRAFARLPETRRPAACCAKGSPIGVAGGCDRGPCLSLVGDSSLDSTRSVAFRSGAKRATALRSE